MKLAIFIIIISLIIFVYLIDNLDFFKNLKFKFINFFMKHYYFCMFITGFIIKLLFSNLFSLNKDFAFILYAEDIIKKKGDLNSYGILVDGRRVPKTEDIILSQNTQEVEADEQVSF